MALTIYALESQEGPAIWFLDTLTLVKATSAQTGGAFALVEQLAPVGSGSPYHVHRADDEAFYVLEGEVEFISEGRRFVKGPGGYVFLPRNIPHGFRVVGASTARYLVLATPGGFDGFVMEAGRPAPAPRLPAPSVPNMDELVRLAAKYRIEVLGPLPE